MDRREIMKRRLAVEAKWNIPQTPLCKDIGRAGCHDIAVASPQPTEIQPGEPYYTITLDVETGRITHAHFDGEGNEISRDEA